MEKKLEHLYHGSTRLLSGDFLHLGKAKQNKNNIDGYWVFATHLHYHAAMYALPVLGHTVAGPLENDANAPANYLVIESSREDYLWMPVEGYIYRVPASDFCRVYGPRGGATNEWVCPHPAPIDRAMPIEHITSIDQVLAAGVQILFVGDKTNFETVSQNLPDLSKTPDYLAALVKSCELIWENHIRNICPARVIAATLSPAETESAARPKRKLSPVIGPLGNGPAVQ